MRVKWTALMIGCFMGIFFFLTGLAGFVEDGLSFSEWLGTLCFSVAAAVATTWLYFHIQRYLRKKGLSLHDDSDFDEE